MVRSIHLLLRRSIPEEKLLAVLNDAISEGAESLDYPKEDAAVFVQYLDHDAEFQQSSGLLWTLDALHLDDIAVAGMLADAFQTDALLQPLTMDLPSGYNWCLVTPGLHLYAVKTVDVDDGIALRHAAPRQRLER